MFAFFSRVLGFENDTFKDSSGKPSTGRKVIAVGVAAMIALIFAGCAVAGLIDPKQSAAMLGFYQSGLGSLSALVMGAFGAVYYAKSKESTPPATLPALVAAPLQLPNPPQPTPPAAPVEPTPPKQPEPPKPASEGGLKA